MKSLFVKTLSMLLAVTLMASGLPGKMMTPPAAEAKSPVEVDQQTAPGIEEAERARALVLESPGLQWIQGLSAKDGLRLKTNRQPLVFLKERNGQRLYGANKQAALFLGEKDGHRIYQILLGFDDPSMDAKPASGSELVDKGCFVFAFVDIGEKEVLDVVRVDIGSADIDGARTVTMRNPTRQAEFLATKEGDLKKVSDSAPGGHRQGTKLNAPLADTNCGISCGVEWSLFCWLAEFTGIGGLICALLAVVICVWACG